MRQSEGDSITENLKDRIEMQKKKKESSNESRLSKHCGNKNSTESMTCLLSRSKSVSVLDKNMVQR